MFWPKARICIRQLSSVNKQFRHQSTRPQYQQTSLGRPLLRVTSFASMFCCYHYLKTNLYFQHIYGSNWLMSSNVAQCLRDDNNRRNRINSLTERQFFESIKSGDISSVRQFIEEKKIDVNCRHEYGWTPLLLAAVNSRADICKLLLDSGADINDADEYTSAPRMSYDLGYNYLQLSMARELEFSDLLSTRVSFRGTTALHYAILVNSNDIVELLTKRGADPYIENEMGHKAIDYVFENNRRLRQNLIEYQTKYSELMAKRESEERIKFPLEQRIKQVIVGQQAAIGTVASAIRRKDNGWCDDNHPLVLLFLGSSGIGKTELAKQIAKYLHKNNEKRGFIRIDMTEYQEKHEASKFIGSPPGYVGHEDGGQLTKALKVCPNAVVLFDEVEKAHNDVLTILLQLFDEGRLTDGKGNTVDCKNAIFIMTSNLGSDEIAEYGQQLRKETEELTKARMESKAEEEMPDIELQVSKQFKEKVIRPKLKNHFKRDEFLGRITEMVYFLPFSRQELNQLVIKELQYWAKQADVRHKIQLTWDNRVIGLIADGYNVHYGARSIKHEVERRIINKIAFAHENQMIKPGVSVHITVNEKPDSDDLKEQLTAESKIKLQLKDMKQNEPVFIDLPINEQLRPKDGNET